MKTNEEVEISKCEDRGGGEVSECEDKGKRRLVGVKTEGKGI